MLNSAMAAASNPPGCDLSQIMIPLLTTRAEYPSREAILREKITPSGPVTK